LVVLVLVYTILLYSTNSLAYTAAYALYLNEFDAGGLPIIYIGVSLFATLVSTLYLKLGERFALSQLLVGGLSFLLLTIIGYRAGLALTPSRWLIFSLPIWYGMFNAFTFLSLWNLLGRLFDLQQGKRLFGLFGAAEQVGTLTTGFFVPNLWC